MTITLNGDPHELPAPMTVAALLAHLDIDARRVAVEHNLSVLKRAAYDTTLVQAGDTVEVVNFVGGGTLGSSACIPASAASVPRQVSMPRLPWSVRRLEG